MLEGLSAAHRRYDELSAQLSQPDAAADMSRYRALMKEYKELEPLSQQYLALAAAEEALAEAKELLYSRDAELSAMAAEQKTEAEQEIARLTEQARLMLLPHDPRDDHSVIMELRAGTGGEEAALFAADLYRMYNLYAAARGWQTELMNANETELGGYREIVFSVEGEKVFSRLKFESGIHRVQRVPVTDSQGKIQTSAVTVAVLPEADEVELHIDPKDLKIDTFRSSGAGGQHVNKTDSAIRITHLPTNIVVTCQNERSQHQNKEMAMKILTARLTELAEQEHKENLKELKGDYSMGTWGAQIRSYVFQPYTMVKDHRTNYETGNVDAVMDGDLDGFIFAYLKAASRGELQDT